MSEAHLKQVTTDIKIQEIVTVINNGVARSESLGLAAALLNGLQLALNETAQKLRTCDQEGDRIWANGIRELADLWVDPVYRELIKSKILAEPAPPANYHPSQPEPTCPRCNDTGFVLPAPGDTLSLIVEPRHLWKPCHCGQPIEPQSTAIPDVIPRWWITDGYPGGEHAWYGEKYPKGLELERFSLYGDPVEYHVRRCPPTIVIWIEEKMGIRPTVARRHLRPTGWYHEGQNEWNLGYLEQLPIVATLTIHDPRNIQ